MPDGSSPALFQERKVLLKRTVNVRATNWYVCDRACLPGKLTYQCGMGIPLYVETLELLAGPRPAPLPRRDPPES